MTDAITKIAAFFPTKTLTVFMIVANVIVNNVGECDKTQQDLIVALLVLFSVLNLFSCFTDTYVASNHQKFWVFIIPFYGPTCFSLPTEYDKDRVYNHFYLKSRDYFHALASITTFLLIIIFTNPVAMCLFPSELNDGTTKFDPSVVRTIPVVVAILMAIAMMTLGIPRQMLGLQNVPHTSPALETQLDDSPMYKYPPPMESSLQEGDGTDEGDDTAYMPPPGPSRRYAPSAYDPSRGRSSNGGSTPPQSYAPDAAYQAKRLQRQSQQQQPQHQQQHQVSPRQHARSTSDPPDQ